MPIQCYVNYILKKINTTLNVWSEKNKKDWDDAWALVFFLNAPGANGNQG